MAGEGWLNTDDRPVIEWYAPWWLHYDTAPRNVQQLELRRSRWVGWAVGRARSVRTEMRIARTDFAIEVRLSWNRTGDRAV